MKKFSGLLISFFLMFLFFSNGSPAIAKSTPQICSGNYTYTTFGDLIVPQGQTCQLDQFNVVNGNIKVEKDASLVICPDNQIHGDVKAQKANSVYISDQTGGLCSPAKALGIIIDGDVKMEGGNSFTLFGNPWGGIAVIHGNVKADNVKSVSIQSFNNLSNILGNVNLEHNGDVVVSDNIIGKDLKINSTSISCLEQNNSVSGKTNSCP